MGNAEEEKQLGTQKAPSEIKTMKNSMSSGKIKIRKLQRVEQNYKGQRKK